MVCQAPARGKHVRGVFPKLRGIEGVKVRVPHLGMSSKSERQIKQRRGGGDYAATREHEVCKEPSNH